MAKTKKKQKKDRPRLIKAVDLTPDHPDYNKFVVGCDSNSEESNSEQDKVRRKFR